MNVKDLSGHWMHSHEEDRDDELVFRPASHQFPRARAGVPASSYGRMGR